MRIHAGDLRAERKVLVKVAAQERAVFARRDHAQALDADAARAPRDVTHHVTRALRRGAVEIDRRLAHLECQTQPDPVRPSQTQLEPVRPSQTQSDPVRPS